MPTCTKCGNENKEGTRFCIKCGNALAAQAQPAAAAQPPQATAPAQAPPTTAPPRAQQAPPYGVPGQPAQPGYQQPTYQQPHAYRQAPPAQQAPPYAYGQPGYPVAAYRGAAPAGIYGGKKLVFWIGAFIVLLAGLMVMVSSFMPWFYGATGWDGFTYNSGFDKVFAYNDGYPLFTGLCTLILGILIILFAVLTFSFRTKGPAVLAIILSLVALGMAITNVTSVVRGDSIGAMQAGMYVFLIFSLAGVVGGSMSLSD